MLQTELKMEENCPGEEEKMAEINQSTLKGKHTIAGFAQTQKELTRYYTHVIPALRRQR